MHIDDVPTPALLLDLDRLEANLDRMARRTRELGVRLRPHAKTHKCVEVARLQRDLGAPGLTVSTLHEARVFADHGFDDMTWAFPVAPSRVPEAAALSRDVTLRVVVDAPEAVDALVEERAPFRVMLQVDCGYGRVGVDPEEERSVELARRVAEAGRLHFDGILTHSGHGYEARGADELAEVAEEERGVMAGFADRLRDEGLEVPVVSVGSTPATTHARDLGGVTEARPGNYAFYDHTQCVIGSCSPEDCALTVLSTVVSSPRGRDHCVCDAGALSLSQDAGPEDASPATMGEIYGDYGEGTLRDDVRLTKLSQEHGTVSASLPVGERVRILENHSCLTAACFDEYHVVRGEEVVDRWKIWRGRS